MTLKEPGEEGNAWGCTGHAIEMASEGAAVGPHIWCERLGEKKKKKEKRKKTDSTAGCHGASRGQPDHVPSGTPGVAIFTELLQGRGGDIRAPGHGTPRSGRPPWPRG